MLDEALEESAFEQFRRQLYATCVAVLDELRQQRFFDQAAGREVFLLFSVSVTAVRRVNNEWTQLCRCARART